MKVRSSHAGSIISAMSSPTRARTPSRFFASRLRSPSCQPWILKPGVAELLAGFGEVGERLRAVQAARLVLAVVGAGVGRQARAEAAEQPRDRRAVLLAGEVPERDVERAVAHVVVGAQLALQVVVDLLAALGVAAEQMRGEHDALRHGGRACRPSG